MSRHLRCTSSVLALVALAANSSHAYNAQTHQDVTAYAFELMSVAAGNPQIQAAFASDPAMLAFIGQLSQTARRVEALAANLPPPNKDFCIDLAVLDRFGDVRPRWPADLDRSAMSQIDYPIAIEYMKNDKSCGVQPDWYPGTLYRHLHENEQTHAGNVLGFWAARPDDLLDDVRLQIRPTNIAPANALKAAIETVGGAAVGTVWIPLKCATKCAESILDLAFDDCKQCVSGAIDEGSGVVHDGVASVDGWFPGIGEFKSDLIVGMCHHIDMKDQVLAPGWSPVPKRRYDDVSGLFALTAGPIGVPGLTELAAIAASQAGVSFNYDASDALKNYQVEYGRDHHPNSTMRSEAEWEYLNWPFIPMTPVDNLAWYGWDKYRASRQAARDDSSKVLQSKYLGWALHGIGDATVPMHATSTFGYGHRPYEDAADELGRALTGADTYDKEMQQAIRVLRAAQKHRMFIDQWRAAHPDRKNDVPLRDLVTRLARDTYDSAMAAPAVFNDPASGTYLNPATRGLTIEGYKFFSVMMRERLLETAAASIAFLSAALEDAP